VVLHVRDKAVRLTARQRPRTKATYSPNTRTSTYFHELWTVRCPEINVLMNPHTVCHTPCLAKTCHRVLFVLGHMSLCAGAAL
jgi:hypothetical protein